MKRMKASRYRGRKSAMTLVELMVSTTVSAIVFGSIMVTFVAQQRSFVAALYQMDAQQDESRVMGYLSKDLRNASAIQLQAGGTEATLTIPAQTSYTLNLNLGLPLLSLLAPPSNAANNTTIVYYRQGAAIMREVNGVATALTTCATGFTLSPAGSMARVDMTFQPRFSIFSNPSNPPATQVTTFVFLPNAGQL